MGIEIACLVRADWNGEGVAELMMDAKCEFTTSYLLKN